jgi:hypothetical protein
VKPIVDCSREDCRIQVIGQVTTCLGWTRTYDKYGNETSVDPNQVTRHLNCVVCGKDWMETK